MLEQRLDRIEQTVTDLAATVKLLQSGAKIETIACCFCVEVTGYDENGQFDFAKLRALEDCSDIDVKKADEIFNENKKWARAFERAQDGGREVCISYFREDKTKKWTPSGISLAEKKCK